ncbi:hypothetical protein [Chitinophaga sp. S165]|uniref:hypothetical protein n=1 Tax=Chitinophaga sp. S165 TaxID=2135462 RepID=UPI000D71D1D0|nr:hypothetical protein [Chitinophaga sp. S165]
MLAACDNDQPWQRGEIDGYAPIYSADPMLKQISFQSPRKTVNGGKLFTAGTNVLQEEADSGLHIISYQDPAHPVKTGFLRIPGFQVAAIEGDYLYANNYNDLIIISLKALSTNMTVGRLADVWKQPDYPVEAGAYFECVDHSKGVVVGWRRAKIKNPQCRRQQLIGDGPGDGENTRNNPGLVVSNGKLYLVNLDFVMMYSLVSPMQPVIAEARNVAGKLVDSIFLFRGNLAIIWYNGFLDLYDTARLDDAGYYNSASECEKYFSVGDTIAYAIPNRYNCNQGTYLTQYELRRDTNAIIRSGELEVGITGGLVQSGQYLYLASDIGLVTVNIAGPTPVKVGQLNDGRYQDIVVNGNLLFLHGREQVVCYSIATSPVSPTLISKLPY